MFVQRVALEAVPDYAVVEHGVLVGTLSDLTAHGELRSRLDTVYRRLESEQPALAEFIAGELSEVDGAAGQALSYFLFLLVYLSFERAFPSRLQEVASGDLRVALERLIIDGEMRERHCPENSYSEDAIALGQPALMKFINAELERAADELSAAENLFEALLLEVLVLTEAVAPLS